MYYYLPLFFTFLNLLITLVLFYYAFFLFKKEQKLNEKNKDSLLEYERILDSATKKAQNILEHTEIISKDIKVSYETVFQKISTDVRETTEDFLRGVLVDQELLLSNFTKEVSEKYSGLFEKTIKSADSNYLQKQKDLDLEIASKLKEASEEIDTYKHKRVTEIDKTIRDSINEVVKNTLPKYVKIEDQEQVVLDVLNKAHEDGFFNKL